MGPLVRLHPDVGDDNPFPVSFRNAVRNLQLGTRREVVAIAKRSLADARDDKKGTRCMTAPFPCHSETQ